MQALLELNCMPAGMELFPAANEEQWDFIKRVIDESDYYVVIVGGRYGSVSASTKQSYTEMEYRYALSAGKPTIAFLHQDPEKLEAARCERTAQGRRKLAAFRRLLEQHLCKYWLTPSDLGGKVSRSLTQLFRTAPAVGWVRADQVPADASKQVTELKRQVLDLQTELSQSRQGSKHFDLARGADKLDLEYRYSVQDPKVNRVGGKYWGPHKHITGQFRMTWDDLTKLLVRDLTTPKERYQVTYLLNRHIESNVRPSVEKKHPQKRVTDFVIYAETLETVKIQLLALGMLELDSQGRWGLTPAGHEYLVESFALHRQKPAAGGAV